MPRTLTVRNVPDAVVRSLRDRAERGRRSMQKEIVSILSSAAVDRASLAHQLSAARLTAGARMKIAEIRRAIIEGRP